MALCKVRIVTLSTHRERQGLTICLGMEKYFVFCFDHANPFFREANLVEAESDAAASVLARNQHPRDKLEVWQGSRLVTKHGRRLNFPDARNVNSGD